MPPTLVVSSRPPSLAVTPRRSSGRRRYQRGIYQPETFKRESKYGLTVLTTTDEGLLHYLNQVSVAPVPSELSLASSDIPRKLIRRREPRSCPR